MEIKIKHMEINVKHSTNEFEKCVLCETITDVKINCPVDARKYYEIGIGQLCRKCYLQVKGVGLIADYEKKPFNCNKRK
ncbi:hypothetical protein [Ruminococcus sp.]|uniref:hypothetical protein n=1 Tax=Ruminococcus sp. TaxID=41978 RepID=UPI0025DAA6C9|nr:hypothetical protein [Ruminococcus sp.]